ncbi:MAG: biopolymer transporter ExbD [Treponema sp.]|jgi:biopolymer transport protein ExbD|nr:biopolymer transporter ExbD [Treponema sp.]
MNIRRTKRRALVESSASSDMAFLLIIYFIVIAGFNVNRGFLVNLPAKDSVRLIRHDDLLRFELDGEGNILYGGEKRAPVFAEGEIRKAVRTNPNVAVLLAVDPRSPWQGVVSFVELAQDLKVDSFSFVMKKESP